MDKKNSIPAPQRPKMPHYGISAAPEGMLDWQWVDEQMTKSRNYWICSTRPNGRAHAAPVWGLWLDGALYFGSHATSRKAVNFRHQPEIVVHLESGDDTVILEGTVQPMIDKSLWPQIAKAYGAKYVVYQPDPNTDPESDWFIFKPHTVLAWQEKSFPGTATKWRF